MMSSISMVESKLPPGFRFHPRDEELVCDYLMKKVSHSDSTLMIEVDLNKSEPWDIPESACVGGKEWYFYSQRDRKYATGLRTNRATASGYWKATGKDKPVLRKGSSSALVGMRKTLVFYQGRAPKGKKTDWVMHEFRLEGPQAPKLSSLKEDWVLCRVFYKNRDVTSAKPSMGVTYYGEKTGSKFLPPLMDAYISFEKPQKSHLSELDYDNNNKNHIHQQVPCFSNNINLPQNYQTHDLIFKHINHMEPNFPIKTTYEATLGGMPSFIDSALTNCLNPSNGDNEVLRVVLDQLNKMDQGNPNLKESPLSGGEGSSESYHSEVGMPNIWSHY